MKKQTKGIIVGTIFASFITSFFEFFVYVSQFGCCDCGRELWGLHQFVLIFLIFFLVLAGIITNFITKAKGIVGKIKEGAIIGIITSIICFIVINTLIPFIYRYTRDGDYSLINVVTDFPIIIFIPLFTGCIIIGSLLINRKEDFSKIAKNKAFLSIVIVLLLIIAPVWLNVSFSSEEDRLNKIAFKCSGWNYPLISVERDSENKTLTVMDVFPQDLNWEDFEIPHHTGTFPSGIISVGDVITNISQQGGLIWKPCDKVIFTWDFNYS